MPKKNEITSCFNYRLFEEICEKLKNKRQDFRKFAKNIGVSYDTIHRIRRKERVPLFSMVANMSVLLKIPIENFIDKSKINKFTEMNQNKRGRKQTSIKTVRSATRHSGLKKLEGPKKLK